MKKTLLSSLIIFSFFLLAIPAFAHSSGCHTWHSCPSDTGSYVCGDKGYCSECPDNQYCKSGVYSPSTSGSSSSSSISTLNLAGYWKFDDVGSGTSASDSSGNGLTGTVSGATWVDGISGKALNFENVNDYMTLPANSKLTFSNGNFTTEAWFKLPQKHQAGSSNKWILLKNGEYGLYLNGNNGYLQFYFSDSYQYSTKNNWDANTWYHVAGVHNSDGSWKIFINGVLDTSGSKSYLTTATCSFDVGNFLGCQTAHDNFVGAIDEVKIYSRPLSASEVLAEYQSFPATTTSPSGGGSSSATSCTINWTNAGCGVSPCSLTQMKQTQKCYETNSSGYSSVWENSKCVANETCNPTVCTMDMKQCPDGSYVARNRSANCEFYSCPTITPTPTNCSGAALDIISSKATSSSFQVAVQNVGQNTLSNFTVVAKRNDNSVYTNTAAAAGLSIPSGSSAIITLPDITSTSGCPLSMLRVITASCPGISIETDNTIKSICEGQSPSVCAQVVTSAKNPTTNECKNFATPCDVPSGWVTVGGCTKANTTPPTITPIKEVDKTVLLDVLFGLEQVKIKLDSLKDSALAISDYYGGKGDTAKAGKWLEISNSFNNVINSIDGIASDIKQNRSNITADFIKQIKTKVAGVKAEILLIVDKVIEVI